MGTLNLPSTSLIRLKTGESWPLHRAKAACLFWPKCSTKTWISGSLKKKTNKNCSVSAAFRIFWLVWVCVNVFPCWWYLEINTLSKGQNSRREVRNRDESLNSRWEVSGGAGGFFVSQFKRLLTCEYKHCHGKCFGYYPLCNPWALIFHYNCWRFRSKDGCLVRIYSQVPYGSSSRFKLVWS